MGKSNIQILVESGADAMDNMWAAKFYWPFDETVGAADLVWRIESFDIPEAKVKTYKKTFLGVEYTKTASGMDLSRDFTLTLTMDATYAIYNRFLTWQKAKIDANNGGSSNFTPYLGAIEIYALGQPFSAQDFNGGEYLDAEGNFGADLQSKSLVWKLYDVAINEVGSPKFKNSKTDGSPMTYTVKGTFGRFKSPFYDNSVPEPGLRSTTGVAGGADGPQQDNRPAITPPTLGIEE